MGLIGDWFGEDLERGWNDFWSDPLGETHDFVADSIWDPILDVIGMDESDRKKALADLAGVPVIGDVLKFADTRQRNADYFKNRGMDWSDVKYPALMGNGVEYLTGALRQSTTNFVSDNIASLYDDYTRRSEEPRYVQMTFE